MIEQGKKSERIDTVIKLLGHRFDFASDTIRNRLDHCSLDQLDTLIDPALDAPDLEAFLAHLPKADPVSTDEHDNEVGSDLEQQL